MLFIEFVLDDGFGEVFLSVNAGGHACGGAGVHDGGHEQSHHDSDDGDDDEQFDEGEALAGGVFFSQHRTFLPSNDSGIDGIVDTNRKPVRFPP